MILWVCSYSNEFKLLKLGTINWLPNVFDFSYFEAIILKLLRCLFDSFFFFKFKNLRGSAESAIILILQKYFINIKNLFTKNRNLLNFYFDQVSWDLKTSMKLIIFWSFKFRILLFEWLRLNKNQNVLSSGETYSLKSVSFWSYSRVIPSAISVKISLP